MTDLMTTPTVTPTDQGDHDAFAHIVPPQNGMSGPAASMEALVNGTPCRAMCGKMLVPSKDESKLPMCATCIEVFEQVMGRPWHGRR